MTSAYRGFDRSVQYSSHTAGVLTHCLSNPYQVALQFGKVARQGQSNLSAHAHPHRHGHDPRTDAEGSARTVGMTVDGSVLRSFAMTVWRRSEKADHQALTWIVSRSCCQDSLAFRVTTVNVRMTVSAGRLNQSHSPANAVADRPVARLHSHHLLSDGR